MASNYNKLLPLFADWLGDQSYAYNTRKGYLWIVERFLIYLHTFNIIRLSDVSKDLLNQFITQKKGKLYSEANINLRQSVLGLFYAWAYANKYCRTNPLIEYKKAKLNAQPFPKKAPKHDDAIIVLSSEEQQELLNIESEDDFTTARNRCITSIILSCALYAEEVINLRIDDISLDDRYINIPCKKHGERRVQINFQTLKFCCDWLVIRKSILCKRKSPLLFFTDKIKHIGKRTLYKIISKSMTNAGIKKTYLGPNVLRQTAIADMLSLGKTIEEVQAITGIKTLKNIQKYYRTTF